MTGLELALRSLRQVAHNGAQAEVSGQVRDEAADTEGLAGVELYLAPGEVREDGACGVDGILTLQADEVLALPETLLASGVEARLSSPRAADYRPSTSTPQAPFESNPNRRDYRLVRAPFEVSDNGVSSRVMVLAESLRCPEEVLRSKYPEGEVRLVFRLDGEHIFAGYGEGEEIEGQILLK